jgi:nicotinate-nucleotide adenylyltransferase
MNSTKIGVIGGTFNPIHIAHLIIAELFSFQLKLDVCFFEPANITPFKINDTSTYFASSSQRIEMIKLAISSNPIFQLDTYEIDNGGISYTYRTIEYFKNKFPDAELFFLIGTDQALKFKEWKNWEYILENIQICLVIRTKELKNRTQLHNSLTINKKSPLWIESPYLEISSSTIRNNIIEGKSIKYLVPQKVEEYIHLNNLYVK